MTTHNVEIRPVQPAAGIARIGGWQLLTRAPVTRRDADNLAVMIGPHWEVRVVAIDSPMGVDFAELERVWALRGHVAVRWQPARVNHHPECPGTKSEEHWQTRTFSATDVMTGVQWLAMDALRKAAASIDGNKAAYPDVASVVVDTPIVHEGLCLGCSGRASALSIKVTMLKDENRPDGDLSRCVREYLLP